MLQTSNGTPNVIINPVHPFVTSLCVPMTLLRFCEVLASSCISECSKAELNVMDKHCELLFFIQINFLTTREGFDPEQMYLQE
jgi:hypothetical protein